MKMPRGKRKRDEIDRPRRVTRQLAKKLLDAPPPPEESAFTATHDPELSSAQLHASQGSSLRYRNHNGRDFPRPSETENIGQLKLCMSSLNKDAESGDSTADALPQIKALLDKLCESLSPDPLKKSPAIGPGPVIQGSNSLPAARDKQVEELRDNVRAEAVDCDSSLVCGDTTAGNFHSKLTAQKEGYETCNPDAFPSVPLKDKTAASVSCPASTANEETATSNVDKAALYSRWLLSSLKCCSNDGRVSPNPSETGNIGQLKRVNEDAESGHHSSILRMLLSTDDACESLSLDALKSPFIASGHARPDPISRLDSIEGDKPCSVGASPSTPLKYKTAVFAPCPASTNNEAIVVSNAVADRLETSTCNKAVDGSFPASATNQAIAISKVVADRPEASTCKMAVNGSCPAFAADKVILISKENADRPETSTCNPDPERQNPGSTFSLGLTEMANMCDDEDSGSDEVESLALVTVGQYQVKQSSKPILDLIFDKYGDIAENYVMQTSHSRALVLDEVCEIIQTFQDKKFSELTQWELERVIGHFRDLALAQLNIGWLLQRFEEIFEVKQLIKQSSALKRERDRNDEVVKRKKRELEAAQAEAARTREIISNAKKKVTFFVGTGLMEKLF